MYKILSGKEPSAALLSDLKEKVASMEKKPHLAIVLVGTDPASEIYVRKKLEKAEAIGVKATLKKLDENTSEHELLNLVKDLNGDPEIHGFIVQSPLPKQIDEKKVIEAIDPEKDVDGWTSANMGRMFLGLDAFLPATPAGVMEILKFYDIDPGGKNVTVIGRSNVVGKPLAFLLLQKNATVTICHSRTKDLKEHTENADIVIAAVGKPGLVTAEMVKEGSFIIDVGTTRVDGKLRGDVDFENVIKKANCSPVPGGVGPMTVSILISNVVRAAENSN